MTRIIITDDDDLDNAIAVIKAQKEYSVEKPYMLVFEKKEKWKTEKQNRLFHKLLDLFYYSGFSSFENPDHCKNNYKKKAGIDVESYTYFDLQEMAEILLEMNAINEDPTNAIKVKRYAKPHRVYEFKDLPKNSVGVIANYKSWATATKKQAQQGLDSLLADIYTSGANTDTKIQEVLKDLEGDRLEEYEK
jgi:hypothetical protein